MRDDCADSQARGRLRVAVCGLLVLGMLLACSDGSGIKRVRRLQAEGKYRESLKVLDKSIERDPDNAQVHYLMGVAYVKLGKVQRAIEPLRKASTDPRFLAHAANLEASIQLGRSNPSGALAATERVLAAEPDNSRSLLLRARARAELGIDLTESLQDVEAILARQPGIRLAEVTRAALLLRLDRPDEADSALGPIEAGWLAGVEFSANKGLQIRWCDVRLELAVARAEREPPKGLFGYCLRELGEEPQLRLGVLHYYQEQDDTERVEEILRSSLARAPANLKVREGLARALMSAGRSSEATELLVEGAEMSEGEDRFQALWGLVEHYESLQEYGLAIEALESAMQLQADPRLPFRLVDLLARDDQLDRAMELARSLEGQVYVDLGVGRVLLAQGRPGEALERFDAGLAVWPENAGAHYYAALAAEELGDVDRAMAEYRASLRADPEASDAAARLALLDAQRGRPGSPSESDSVDE